MTDSGCPICTQGEPLGVLVERPTTWITSDDRAIAHGYLCVVSKRHVVDPIRVNYEIHGNTLAHLHAHVYARFRGDRFVGGPIDNRLHSVENVLPEALREALA